MIRLNTDKTTEIIKTDRGDISITYIKDDEMCHAVIQNNYKHVYGMGEKFDYIDHKGHTCINCVEEKFCNQGDKTYCSIPFFFTDSGWGLYVETDYLTSFEFEKEIRVNFPLNASLFLFQGNPLEIIKEFNNCFGVIDTPPEYAFGPWISANRWNNQKDVEEVVTKLEKYDFPATVLVLEAWSDESTFYIWNGAKYKEKNGKEPFKYEDFDFSESAQWSDPRQMVADLAKKGIHTVLWQIPAYKKMEEAACNFPA